MKKKLFKYPITTIIIVFLLFIIIKFTFIEYDYYNFGWSVNDIRFPELAGPRTAIFKWEYGGKEYEITETLYKSTYEFYQNKNKGCYTDEESLDKDWSEDCFARYTKFVIPKIDNSLSDILDKIKHEADNNNLSDNETAELVLAFVQSIPYDFNLMDILKAREINPEPYINSNIDPKFPYEVLYENSGMCVGKSTLAYNLLNKLGYGVVLFHNHDESHVAVGIKCTKEYSTYNSGYCYAETTNTGHQIGEIPSSELGNDIARPDVNKIILETDGKMYNI